MLSLKQYIVLKDIKVWYYLNVVWRNAFLDFIIPFFRNQFFWAPLYLFLLAFMLMNYGRRGIFWCLGFLLSFGLSDYISASVFKEHFKRTRPCNTDYLLDIVHLIVPRSSGYSFPSSHAANHFSLGVFMALTLGQRFAWVRYAAIAWALLVGYSQVYVGVHFPFDVLCGGILGSLIGWLVARFYNHRFGSLAAG